MGVTHRLERDRPRRELAVMVHQTHVLLVEDDGQTRLVLATALGDAGFHVTSAADGTSALALLTTDQFDVVVTDIRMRYVSGIDVMTAARALAPPPEVIILTGYGSLETALAALRAGAFDYLLKPVNTSELLSCVRRAAQRRADTLRELETLKALATPASPMEAAEPNDGATERPGRYLQVGRLVINRFRRTATLSGATLHLTPIEFELLAFLAENPGETQSCAAIVRRTHRYELPEAEAQTLLRSHVRNLRRKLPHGYLETDRGMGYRLSAGE